MSGDIDAKYIALLRAADQLRRDYNTALELCVRQEQQNGELRLALRALLNIFALGSDCFSEHAIKEAIEYARNVLQETEHG